MANNAYPVYNGIAPSWSDVSVRLAGTDVPLLEARDIVGLDDSSTVEVGETVAGGRVIKTTTGKGKNEGSLKLYREGHNRLLRGLIANAPVRGNQKILSMVHFDVEIQYTPQGSTETYLKRWKGCRVIGDAESGAEGTDATQVEVTVHVKEIARVIDGVEVVLL
jgi:hypothetical protein